MGNFLKMVRHGHISGPRKRSFTCEKWKLAFDQQNSGDAEDLRLFNSGLRIHTKLTAIRSALSTSKLSKLSTATAVKALVAAANHQYEAIDYQMRQAIQLTPTSEIQNDLDILDIAGTRLNLIGGESFTIDATLSSLLDGIRTPIRFALQGKTRLGAEGLANVPWADVQLEMNLGIFFDQFESLWEDCVWNTYAIAGKDQRVLALPQNPDAKRGMHAAIPRKIALGLEATTYAIHALDRATAIGLCGRVKEVQSIETDGDKQVMELGDRPKSPHDRALLYAIFMMACPHFLSSILEEPRERLGGASINQLFDGWMVLSSAATALWNKSSPLLKNQHDQLTSEYSDMSEYIPFLDMNVLVQTVREAAGLPLSAAEAIIKFLVFDGTDGQEFWTQPLVKADNSSKLYIVAGAIVAPPNARYIAEKWMTQLGVDLESRGPAFESHIRSVLLEATSTSPLLSKSAKVVPKDFTFHSPDQRFAQIDAIFCVGASVFIVEAKCILEPTDATSTGTHRASLERAALQAKFRVQLIDENRQHFIEELKKFGWTLPIDFRIYPMIAVSTWAHVGIPVNNVPVVDELVIQRFFDGKYRRVGLCTEKLSTKHSIEEAFYESATEAERTAAHYFSAPPQLKQYIDNLVLRKFRLYAFSEDDWEGEMLDYDQRSAQT